MKLTSSARAPIRPAQMVEHHIITGILAGTYPTGKPLPNERRLAETIGVARPPLRETLHRLATEGWLTIAHGKPTLVNDYWEEGGMGLLSTLAKYIDALPSGFISHLMEVRSRLLPVMGSLAAGRAPDEMLALLEAAKALDDDVAAFVDFDWRLQLLMASQSGNPIYRLILNDFSRIFETMAAAYFRLPEARALSRSYYNDLAAAIRTGTDRVETIVADAMDQSEALWKRLKRG